jgi:integrase
MRQVKLGEWPAMSFHAAVAQWEVLRQRRDGGVDLSLERKKHRRVDQSVRQADGLTVAQVCKIYLDGHVKNRAKKGRDEVERTFNTMLDGISDMPAVAVTRKIAFTHIKKFDNVPVQAGNLRRELGAAWDYCLDSGDLPEEIPNWWRLVLRGKLKSKGRAKLGVKSGVKKRVLSPAETGTLIRWFPNFSRNVADMLTLYLWTGTRGAEIEKMEGVEVAEESDGLWWTIPKAKTKNAHREDADDQRVLLVGRAEEIVRQRKRLFVPVGQQGRVFFPEIGRRCGISPHAIQPHGPGTKTCEASG